MARGTGAVGTPDEEGCLMTQWVVVGALVVLPGIAGAESAWVLWWREAWFTNQDMQRTNWMRFSSAPTLEGCDAMLKGAMEAVIDARQGDRPDGRNVVEQSEGFMARDISTGPDGARYTIRM